MKNVSRGILTLLIVLAVFSVIAFVIPVQKNTVFWISYGCGVFAILFQGYILFSAFGKRDARSRFYGLPVVRVGICYLVTQLLVSIGMIALAEFIPTAVTVIVDVLILAAALLGCIVTTTVRDEITRQDSQLKDSVSSMRELQSFAAGLAEKTGDAELKKSLQKLADEFRYSDPKSSEKTREPEAEMLNQIRELQQALEDGDTDGAGALCKILLDSLRERNRICAINK